MAGIDGSINIKTEIDNSGVDKGLKDLKNSLGGAEKSALGLSKGMIAAGVSIAGVTAAIKATAKVVGDLTASYREQVTAETQIAAAAKNNPYINSSGVKALQDFAGEMQSLTTDTDSAYMQVIAKLTSYGHTQDEVMQIVRASADMAAAGVMDLGSAADALHKTYAGQARQLGQMLPELKGLTEEEMKRGDAVKLVAARYDGMAKTVADAAGSSEQLKNAWGDLKDELGGPFERALTPVRKFFQGIIDGWTNALAAKNKYHEAKKAEERGDASIEQTKLLLETTQAEIDALEKNKKNLQTSIDELKKKLPAYAAQIATGLPAMDKRIAKLKEQAEIYKTIVDKKQQEEEAEKRAIIRAQEQAEIESKKIDAAQKLKDYIDGNTKARTAALKALEETARIEGREITNAELLNVYQSSYVDLIANSEGRINATSAAAKDLLKTTQDLWQKEIDINAELDAQEEAERLAAESAKEAEESKRKLAELIEDTIELSESEKLQKQLDALGLYYDEVINNEQITLDEKLKLHEEYAEAVKRLEQNITDLQKAENEQRIKDMLQIVQDFMSTYTSTMSNITRLANDFIETESKNKIAKIEQQYQAGEVSAEEYEAKLVEIDKETKRKRYKIAMWEWSANLLTSITNTALGITKALAEGGVLGLITGGLVAAAGAAQTALIVANKPLPPAFATGGIVGGSSYSGDRVEALVNSGEMILNTAQQKRLFDTIDRGQISRSPNIKIYNTAANDVEAKPSVTEDGVRIMIRKIVSKDMAEGRFNGSYKAMQAKMRGTRYTN